MTPSHPRAKAWRLGSSHAGPRLSAAHAPGLARFVHACNVPLPFLRSAR